MRFNSLGKRVWRWCQIVAIFFTILSGFISFMALFVPLPLLLLMDERTRITLLAMGPTFLTVALSYRCYPKFKALRAQQNQDTGPPTFLLAGGLGDGPLITAVLSDPDLKRDPYVVLKGMVFDGKNQQQAKEALRDHDLKGLILLPNCNSENTPEAYCELAAACKNFPLPAGRFYPAGYTERKRRDFQILPFDTAEKIVRYSSEFIASKASAGGRLLQTKIDLNNRITTVLVAILVLALIWIVTSNVTMSSELAGSRTENDARNRALIISPVTSREKSSAQRDLESRTIVYGNLSGYEKDKVRQFLQTFVNSEVRDIANVTGDSKPIVMSIYAIDGDNKTLVSVADSGAPGPQLSVMESIGGCAYTQRAITEWDGDGRITSRIRAWTTADEEMGQYNSSSQELLLKDGRCKLASQPGPLPKKQLLCIPIGVDTNNKTIPVSGVACILAEGANSFISKDWFRGYLCHELFPIGMFDLKWLIPFSRDTHPMRLGFAPGRSSQGAAVATQN